MDTIHQGGVYHSFCLLGSLVKYVCTCNFCPFQMYALLITRRKVIYKGKVNFFGKKYKKKYTKQMV